MLVRRQLSHLPKGIVSATTRGTQLTNWHNSCQYAPYDLMYLHTCLYIYIYIHTCICLVYMYIHKLACVYTIYTLDYRIYCVLLYTVYTVFICLYIYACICRYRCLCSTPHCSPKARLWDKALWDP